MLVGSYRRGWDVDGGYHRRMREMAYLGLLLCWEELHMKLSWEVLLGGVG